MMVGVFIRAQEKACMDETMMLEWTDLVWEPATEGRRALLILDSFLAHITVTKQKLKEDQYSASGDPRSLHKQSATPGCESEHAI